MNRIEDSDYSSTENQVNASGVDYPLPASKTDPDYDFEVEKIKASDLDETGQMRYLVKWKGYPDSDNTEETLQQLTGCRSLLKETLIKNKKSKSFKISPTLKAQSKVYCEKLSEALLKGSSNVEGYRQEWPVIEKSKNPKVLAQFEDDDSLAVWFDSKDMAVVPMAKFLEHYDAIGRQAVIDFYHKCSLKS